MELVRERVSQVGLVSAPLVVQAARRELEWAPALVGLPGQLPRARERGSAGQRLLVELPERFLA